MGCVPQQLFGSAVAHYARVPQGLIDALAARGGFHRTQRVLDIGCGTGQITISLARHAHPVVAAIDPVEGTLVHGRQAAQAAGPATSAG